MTNYHHLRPVTVASLVSNPVTDALSIDFASVKVGDCGLLCVQLLSVVSVVSVVWGGGMEFHTPLILGKMAGLI